MEQNMKITFLNLQIALFFSEALKVRPDRLAMTINKELGNMFDEIPLMLPLGKNIPAEIQMLEMKSSIYPYRCTSSMSRTDLYYRAKTTRVQKFSYHKENFKQTIERYFSAINSFEEINISRVGYITHFFLTYPSPSTYLKEKFIKTNKINKNLYELSLRYNVRQNLGDFEVNNITRLDPTVLSGTDDEGIRIQRDVNTQKEKEYIFDENLFKNFVITVESLLSSNNIMEIFT